MTSSLIKRIAPQAAQALAIALLVFGISGCGGGGGSDDVANQPAPQTFNGLVLTLYTQGPALTCIRAEGDATTGVETGSVEMAANPGSTIVTDAKGSSSILSPSASISGGRYTYTRTGPESGTLTIEGAGSGLDAGILPSNYFQPSSFKRTYSILFGTDGSTITGISVNDVGVIDKDKYLIPYPGILWTGATLRLYGGAAVPIAWNLQKSEGLDLPKLYPDGVNQQRLQITPTNVAEPLVGYQFLNSAFTRFSSATGDFIEEGVGNMDLPPNPALTLINFDYQPDPKTTNRARIRIYQSSKSTVEYDMIFLDKEKGTYTKNDGSTGTFEFPFLN